MHRHRPGARRRSRLKSLIKPVSAFLIVGLVLFWLGSWFVGLVNFGGRIERGGVTLSLDERSNVNVSLEGAPLRQAENNMKLYPGDSVNTQQNATALLTFFDESFIRLDENTEVQLLESVRAEEESEWSVHLSNGTLWATVGSTETYSGSIKRFVSTAGFTASLPASTQAVFKEGVVSVFDSEGIGLLVTAQRSDASIYVGEGQTWTLNDAVATADEMYESRSALDPLAVSSPFVEESRSMSVMNDENGSRSVTAPASATGNTDELSVSAPADGATIATATVTVNGTAPSNAEGVRVNGYNAQLEDGGNFTLDLALPDSEQVPITVEALSEQGEVIARVQRTINRNLAPPPPPTFISPARTGQTYRTDRRQFEITGGAPEGTVGIIVNDYRLRFFQPGDDTWTYLANADLGNVDEGRNVFRATAVNAAGIESEAAELTIILGDEEGLVDESDSDADEEEDETIALADLPDNDPLYPGTLRVTGPTEGTRHTATGSEMLIEGIAPEGAQSVWVNDYRLRLFNPERGYWNYIASAQLNTLRSGRNTYQIVARDAENRIMDRVTYVIEFTPR